MFNKKEKEIINILKNDGVGIMPTDTLYGLIGSAFSRKAINKIYKIKNRDKKKKLIILISSLKDLEKFRIKVNKDQAKILKKFWPGKVSIILNNIAFRLPKNKKLLEILKETGPLVAPSANPEGLKPAGNIKEAKIYFGDKVDFYFEKKKSYANSNLHNVRTRSKYRNRYLSRGTTKRKPSNLIKINKNGRIEVLRGTIKK